MQQPVPVLVVMEDAAGVHADPLLRHEGGAAGRPLPSECGASGATPGDLVAPTTSRKGLFQGKAVAAWGGSAPARGGQALPLTGISCQEPE